MATAAKPVIKQSNVVGAKQPAENVGKVNTPDGPVEAEKRVKRPRPVNNVGTIFTSLDEAKKLPPTLEDGKTTPETTKLFKVTVKATGFTSYVWASNPDQALAYIVGEAYDYGMAEPSKKGRGAKIDPHLLNYAKIMKKMKMDSDLAAFLAEFPQYTEAVNAA